MKLNANSQWKIPMYRKSLILSAGILLIGLNSTASLAQQSKEARLPGGATTIQETYDDWSVRCEVKKIAEGADVRQCALSQQQMNNKGQMVLSIQLQPIEDGANGVLVLPFGLAVTQGITLQIDEHTPENPMAFSTCVPAGCIVPLTFNASVMSRIMDGSALKVNAQSSQGQETSFTVPLRGQAAALSRTRDLLN